jgi:hypothetical protein
MTGDEESSRLGLRNRPGAGLQEHCLCDSARQAANGLSEETGVVEGLAWERRIAEQFRREWLVSSQHVL